MSDVLVYSSINPKYSIKLCDKFMYIDNMSMYWTCNSMNNILLFCGLINARIIDKEQPVLVVLVNYGKTNFKW